METLVDTTKSQSADPLLDLEQKTGKTVYELFAAAYLAHHQVRPEHWTSGKAVPCPPAPMHAEMFRRYRKSRRCVVVLPGKFAKSTCTSFMQPLADGVLGLIDGDLILISNTGRLAEKWLEMIKDEIEHNQDIIYHFGNLKGNVWRQDRIKLRTGIEIVSLGLNYQIRSTGFAKIIPDDLENDEMVRSEEQRDKFSDWFDGALLGRMHPQSQLTMTGNFLHPLCKIKKIHDNADGKYGDWDCICFAALDENDESTWPDRWPTEIVHQQRIEMGHKAFMAEKMNEPIFGKDHIFQAEWIKYYDQLPQNLYVVTMTDASSSKEKDIGDYTAITVWGKDLLTENIYLLANSRGRWPKHSKVKAVLDYNHAFHPVFNLIENCPYGKELRVSLSEEAKKRGQYFPYRMIPANKQKIERAQMIVDLWEKGMVFLPKKISQRLIDELLMFPFGDYDDYVDSTSGALNFLRRQRAKPKPRKYIYRPELQPSPSGRLT